MAEKSNQVQNEIGSFFQKLSSTQKFLLGVVAIGVVGGIIALVSVVNRPIYSTLFSNVNAQDASKIVDKLKERGVQYKLEGEGRTILVPKDQMYELRLALAGEGLPQSSTVGYEIFDRTNLGVSDFVQKINYRRALEGELARTILQIGEVDGVRVHIVTPEKALFQEDEKPATASVILKLKTGKPLAQSTVQGITHLIASSVEGLDPANVTVVDSRGVVLSENTKANSATALTATQYDLQKKVEDYIAQKAQGLLEGVLGTGNATVQVSALLDFRQVERTLEQYDPEKTVVRSEQITEEKNGTNDTNKSGMSRSNSVTNYEVNKTVERVVENSGSIKRLTVAALINGKETKTVKDGTTSTEYAPRPKEEMDQLTEIIKRAVGFDSQRNDEVTVINHPFDKTVQEQDLVYKDTPLTDWYDIADKVFIVVAMIAGALIIRSLLNKIRVQVGSRNQGVLMEPAIHAIQSQRVRMPMPSPEDEISEDAMMRVERRKQISNYMKDKPDDASRLVKVWLTEN